MAWMRRNVQAVFVPIGDGAEVAFCALSDAETFAAGRRIAGLPAGTPTVRAVSCCTWCSSCGWRIGDCVGADMFGTHPRFGCPELRYEVTAAAAVTVSAIATILADDGIEAGVDDTVLRVAGEYWAVGMSPLDAARFAVRDLYR